MKRILLFLLFPSLAFAQSVRYQSQAIGSRGIPMANQNVAVCSQPANTSTTPCSPLATLATSTSTTSGGTNPLSTDVNGNFFFYAIPGNYTVQIYGPQISTAFVMTDTNLPPSLNANNAYTGNNTFCQSNSILYVGGSITCWAGADIGAQLNTVYASLPAAGGTIYLLPQTGGGCYAFTTPILFNTLNKPVTLIGSSPPTLNTGTGGETGTCIRYSPTTATVAMTLDWTNTSGGSYNAASGIRDLALINGATDASCFTGGGCGSLAVGIQTGGTNGGAHKALFQNLKVQGFGNGFKIVDAGTAGWGLTWFNSNIVWNTTGINYTVPHENDQFISGVINSNGVGVALGGGFGGEFRAQGVSHDANTTCAYTMTDGAVLGISNSHFENTSLGTACYVDGGATASSKLSIDGSTTALDLVTTGTFASTWFKAGLLVVNMQLTSFGRTTTVPPIGSNTRGIAAVTANPTTAFSGGVFAVGANQIALIPGNPSIVGTQATQLLEIAAPSGIANANIDACYADSTLHALNCNYNNSSYGFFQSPYPIMTTSVYTNATTTPSNIPGLSFPVLANRNYTAQCTLYYQGSVGTAGLDMTVTGPATPTSIIYGYIEEASATGGAQDSVATAFGTKLAGAGTITATTNFPSTVTISLRNGANAGTVQLQGSATGVGTVTVQPGSYCTVQ